MPPHTRHGALRQPADDPSFRPIHPYARAALTRHLVVLAAAEREELAVLERYLPARMDDAALSEIIGEEIERARAAGATGPKAMGAVVKAVRARVGDAADGSLIASRVKELLGS